MSARLGSTWCGLRRLQTSPFVRVTVLLGMRPAGTLPTSRIPCPCYGRGVLPGYRPVGVSAPYPISRPDRANPSCARTACAGSRELRSACAGLFSRATDSVGWHGVFEARTRGPAVQRQETDGKRQASCNDLTDDWRPASRAHTATRTLHDCAGRSAVSCVCLWTCGR